jgi:PIN domain nuclease of toxin-antitoxin system
MPSVEDLAIDFRDRIASQGFSELPITVEHGDRAGSLPGHHRDPFDRMLIAQAISEDLVLISNETLFDRYGVRRLW